MKTKGNNTASISGAGKSSSVDPALRDNLQTSAAEGQPLDSNIRRQFEDRFQHSFADVRVISSRNSAQIADRLNARALTVGRNIWFANGEYRPNTISGQRLLAHELVHTIQQGNRGGGIQKDMRIGQRSDPAEVEATAVADAAMKGKTIPSIRQSSQALSRDEQPCTVSDGASSDQRIVTCSGQRYRVTVVIESSSEPETSTSFDWGLSRQEIWLDFEICRGGTEVNIRVSAGNLSDALQRILENVVRRSGTFQGVTIQPEAQITISRSRDYAVRLRGGPLVDIGQGEVIGGGGGISVDTRYGTFGLGGEGRRGEGGLPPTVNFPFSYTPGDTRPETIDCSTIRKRLRIRCERLTTIPAVPATEAVRRPVRREVYLLYPYRKSDPVQQVLIRDEAGAVTTSDISGVNALITEGYRVQSIAGYASPEGPRAASSARRFQGNDKLSQERADATQRWLAANCPGSEGELVTPVGQSELYSTPGTPELEGRALRDQAAAEYLAGDPLRPTTEAERQAQATERVGVESDSVYQRLRRGVIVLSRMVEVQPANPGSPAREDASRVTCPDAVRDAIRRHFGIPVI